MKLTNLICTDEAQSGFYPTPPQLGKKLTEGLDWEMIQEVLEPSAGKGNLVSQAISDFCDLRHYSHCHLSVDCVEIDPVLRGILNFEFSHQREEEAWSRYDILRDSKEALTITDKLEMEALKKKVDQFSALKMQVVHDDFLTFNTRKQYDLILMNPPFENGERHLIKAIEIQSRYGGAIRCILNAETLLNPYTSLRITLKQMLQNLNAEIEFVQDAFTQAERKTDVQVAIIKVDIPKPQRESSIFERLTKAAKTERPPVDNASDLTLKDFIEHIVSLYNVEVDAGVELIQEYEAMLPYIMNSLDDKIRYKRPTLSLRVSDQGDLPSINKYIHLVRNKYWEALFAKEEFIGKMTSNLQKKYRSLVDEMSNYDFSVFNIKVIQAQMNAELTTGVKETILAMFDRLTAEHSWYPETQKNIHYFNGWKTNQVHKIGNKSILPTGGMFSSYSRGKPFEVKRVYDVLSDIEKVFNYLDGHMSAEVSLLGVLERACQQEQTKNIPCKFFDVTLYKKGTMHIRFRSPELVERMNIYAAQNKKWLPPSYGHKAYSNMDSEERAVVDSFHGTGQTGSGEAAYLHVMKNSSYFLSDPTGELPALSATI